MEEIYGKMTEFSDVDNKKLYEYDRVEVDNKIGTIVNVSDVYHPSYKVLLDKNFWKFDNKPEFTSVNNVKLANANQKVWNVKSFLNYCNTYSKFGA